MSKRTAFISGNFNVVHPGHLRLFRYAREKADRLVIGVFSDALGGDQIFIPEALRMDALRSNVLVDEVLLIDKCLEQTLTQVKPDVVIKGHEYEGKENPERQMLEKLGGELIFNSGESAFSSIDLIQREFRGSSDARVQIPSEYLARRGISSSDLVDRVQRLRGVRLLVVGDLIIDEYVTCEPVGISREEPTVVVTPIDTTRFVGGAGIVAAHAASLGADVTFISLAGEDHLADFARQSLVDLGVNAKLVSSDELKTIVKTRYRSQGKNLLRVNSAVSVDARDEDFAGLSAEFRSAVSGVDAVVFSDFDMGCLTADVVGELFASMADKRPFLAADSQARLGLGSLRKFAGVDLVTPTEMEARTAVRDETSGLAALAHRLRLDLNVPNVLLTLGKEGVLISGDQAKLSGQWPTDLLPALNPSPVDVAGAGDCMLVVTTMALATGASIWEASLLGSVAAAVQVGRVGNLPISTSEIIARLS